MSDDRDLTSLPFFGRVNAADVPGLRPVRATKPADGSGPAEFLRSMANPSEHADDSAQPLFEPPVPRPGQPRPVTAEIDWTMVALIRKVASDALTSSLEAAPGLALDQQKALAQAHVTEAITAQNSQIVATAGSDNAWTPEARDAMAKAVLDSLYGLGRLQPLVDEPGVENIDIFGYNNVYVNYADGSYAQKPPIANSDAELLAEIQFLASRAGESGRPFSSTNPILDMDLPGGARLAAVAPPISPRPKIVIRIHRFVDITLAKLVNEHRTLSPQMAALLFHAVRTGSSIVASGHPGAGKTTLLRALADCIDPMEPIVTIEKERELHLDRMGDKHKIVTALQYRPGQGERAADGSMPGEVTLVELLEESLRLNAQRIMVGEVRGGEIDAMFQAMQAGVGSLSTIHADSATNAIERMATLTQRSMNTSDAYAYRQIAQHIDFIVQVSKVRDSEGRIKRVISEIAEVQPGEGARPVASPLFRYDARTEDFVPVHLPSPAMRDKLVHAGLSPEFFTGEQEVA